MDQIQLVLASVVLNQIVDVLKASKEHVAAILSNNFLLLSRLNSEIKVFKRAQELVRKNNISVKALNLKILSPLIENAILEDDTTLQDLWSTLTTNYIDAKKFFNSVIFINILKELTKEESELLLYFNNFNRLSMKEIIEDRPSINILHLINLERLNLIHKIFVYGPEPVYDDKDKELTIIENNHEFPFRHSEYHIYSQFVITPLGFEFLKAVTEV